MKGFLILTCIISSSNSNGFKYIEHHVMLGDPWNVSCHTPFKEPTNWVFISARVDFFKNYLYNEGKLDEYMIGRYNLTISDDKHTNTLQINKTDENHAGRYVCIPDSTTLKHRQFHKLTLVEYSNIELKKIDEITLNMNICFLGFETSESTFICFFTHASKEYLGQKSITDKSFKTYSFIKTYEPDEEVTSRCQILIKNGKPKIWMDKFLHIDPDIDQNEYNEHYVKKGGSWNMSCRTSFHHPMMWLFQGVMSKGNNVTLYKYWKIDKDHSLRYNFFFEPQTITYTMMIPRADVNHAGIYTCTHQSSQHLIEKIVYFTVLENLEIILNSQNVEEPKLTMLVTYAGHNTPQPLFSCLINNESYSMNNMTFCGKNENKLNSCFLSKTFESNKLTPDKCQIHFGLILVKEQSFAVGDEIINANFKTVCIILLSISAILLISLTLVVIAWLLNKLKINLIGKTKNPSKESSKDDNTAVPNLEMDESDKEEVIQPINNCETVGLMTDLTSISGTPEDNNKCIDTYQPINQDFHPIEKNVEYSEDAPATTLNKLDLDSKVSNFDDSGYVSPLGKLKEKKDLSSASNSNNETSQCVENIPQKFIVYKQP